MKYFSLSFNLTNEDYSAYSKNGIKASALFRIKRSMIPLIIFTCLGFIEKTALLFLPLLIASSLIVPYIIDKEYINSLHRNSDILKKELTVDFYDNHFVVSSQADSISKSFSERHYGFDTVAAVNETEGYFYFIFKTNNILIIPKRVLSQEQFGMIRNLIDNLFAKVYKVI